MADADRDGTGQEPTPDRDDDIAALAARFDRREGGDGLIGIDATGPLAGMPTPRGSQAKEDRSDTDP